MPVDPILKALDADTNGVLVATEIANAPAGLKALDKNSDGALSAEEMAPPAPEGAPVMDNKRRPKFASPIVKALDKNSDGILSAEEIAGASAALTALDKNGDGQLTRQELMPGRPGQRGGKAPGEPEPGAQGAPVTE
jgi:Ca2+-binding EF-hand superfamily protein